MENNLTKIIRWIASVALIFTALWSGFLSFLANSYTDKWSGDLEALTQESSLASFLVVQYWPFFLLFALVSFISAVFLAWKVSAPIIFSLSIGTSFLMAVFVFNILVVSAGFELSSVLAE